jgi:hypothetical protein
MGEPVQYSGDVRLLAQRRIDAWQMQRVTLYANRAFPVRADVLEEWENPHSDVGHRSGGGYTISGAPSARAL